MSIHQSGRPGIRDKQARHPPCRGDSGLSAPHLVNAIMTHIRHISHIHHINRAACHPIPPIVPIVPMTPTRNPRHLLAHSRACAAHPTAHPKTPPKRAARLFFNISTSKICYLANSVFIIGFNISPILQGRFKFLGGCRGVFGVFSKNRHEFLSPCKGV